MFGLFLVFFFFLSGWGKGFTVFKHKCSFRGMPEPGISLKRL